MGEFTPKLTTTDWGAEWRELQRFRRHRDDAAYWDARSATYTTKDVPSPYVERFLELAGLREGETVFDMGCGTGALAIPAAEQSGGWSLYGLPPGEAGDQPQPLPQLRRLLPHHVAGDSRPGDPALLHQGGEIDESIPPLPEAGLEKISSQPDAPGRVFPLQQGGGAAGVVIVAVAEHQGVQIRQIRP